MNFRIKHIVIAISLILCLWIGWNSYNYFYDQESPIFSISGIKENNYYCGDVHCIINGHDKYKVDTISVWLDEKPILSNFRINRGSFEYDLPIPTNTLSNGKHEIKIEVKDGSYKKNCSNSIINFFVDNSPLQAAFARSSDFRVFQGRTLHIQFQANKEIENAVVNTFSKNYKSYPESEGSTIYECFIPIECEEKPNEYTFNINVVDKVGNSTKLDGKFQILPYPFKKHSINIASEKVKEEEEIGKPQQELENLVDLISKNSADRKLWNGSFYIPIEMSKVSCEFGTLRTTQQKGCYAHKALDILGAPKSVVWAPQDGIVAVKDRFVQSGNTIVIDHGCGILTLLFHLDNFANINVGDKIRRGNPVGTIGKTGYATGYHLHWEMRKDNIQIDPMEWTKNNF
ncbi:hypothetical protein A3F66_03815 [candidate division TM6 bacterium RIFCSPHIGHO2_12_FULL_32_22]|nr:MAG: hypothetical protein A3F66_03815 [candidate division TM6 bacterium RIFCSPHIGHO2_12_FULL_32_22]